MKLLTKGLFSGEVLISLTTMDEFKLMRTLFGNSYNEHLNKLGDDMDDLLKVGGKLSQYAKAKFDKPKERTVVEKPKEKKPTQGTLDVDEVLRKPSRMVRADLGRMHRTKEDVLLAVFGAVRMKANLMKSEIARAVGFGVTSVKAALRELCARALVKEYAAEGKRYRYSATLRGLEEDTFNNMKKVSHD